MSGHDVYAYGVIASSTLHAIRGTFPAPEGYAEIEDVRHMIGADEAGRRVKALLEQFGIDTSRLPLREGYRGVREVVFTAQGTRTIFGSYAHLLENEDWNMPVEDDIRQSRVVCLDPFFGAASHRVAETAHDAGIPVVTVDCLPHEPPVGHASAVVVSASYLREKFPERPLDAVFQDYLQATRGLVIFTLGANGGWYGRPGMDRQAFHAYPVAAVDTTCAGDSFRAGIVFGFLHGWDDARLVDFAAAVASLVCTRTPGALNSPGYEETLEFMRSHHSAHRSAGQYCFR